MAASHDARDPWIAPGRIATYGDGRPRYDQYLETYESTRAEGRRILGTHAHLETHERCDRSDEAHDGSDAAGYSGIGPDRIPGRATDEIF